MSKNKLLTGVTLIYIFLAFTMPDKAAMSFSNSMYYVIEMLQIMPIIFVLTAIIEAWVPKELIANGFGEKSGIKGNVLSFVLGSLSAGPIYAAFPISKMLLKKGASVTNIVIILGAWAVVKVPMLANEAKFLGIKFMGVRWILTTIAIFMMAYITSIIVNKESIPEERVYSNEKSADIIINQQYCMGCGICVKISPSYFEMENNKAKLKELDSNNKELESVIIAAEKCPFNAIGRSI